MNRSARMALFAAAPVVALLLLPVTSGCVSALATMVYVIKGTNVPAEYKGLRDKRVAVVCRAHTMTEFSHATVDRDLAKEVGRLLRQNVRKIEVIDNQEVARWTDENTWEDFTEIGEALDADMVIGIELDDFRLYQGQTLYQGNAKLAITVHDMENAGAVVWEKSLPQSQFPPNTGMPTAEKTEADFRAQFIGVLADEAARHFYSHDSYANFAMDSKAFY